ncbi:MAG: short chain dehydrogenase [Acidiferrobacteraceae bacterium]|jgi:citronellol/citronellal dehydrogenase|nr:short chain dehydrogenase [Acidiferrobacteraceae bacterium]MCP4827539.1 NAD(P)-dependent oxidoreductase [Pseudomonadota bacterium]HJP06207.1 NAD(P)-dependent oxidoreductase [Arenicellales bacterium]|tara:strand:+ start:1641 stop:2516 length:876 start_codon:yes stop_codon:yes gene_type:complete
MVSLKGKRAIISGGSRGIGLAIAKRLASEGASIAILAKTADPHPKLPGTIYTAAEEIEEAGGKALPILTDVRNDDEVKAAVSQTVEAFGGLDICINNASAISLTKTGKTEMKRFDLMFAVNVRGTFMLSKECLPHLAQGDNPHILNLSPPLDMQTKWFAPSVAYTMSKFGMSQCVLGMAGEFKSKGIAVNALWPHSVIATAAISNVVAGNIAFPHCRKPDIMADAAAVILSKDAREFTGQFCIDDVLLSSEGVTDFSAYRVDPAKPLWSDFFVPDDTPEVEPLVMMMNPGA